MPLSVLVADGPLQQLARISQWEWIPADAPVDSNTAQTKKKNKVANKVNKMQMQSGLYVAEVKSPSTKLGDAHSLTCASGYTFPHLPLADVSIRVLITSAGLVKCLRI